MTGAQHENDTYQDQKHQNPSQIAGDPVGTVQTPLLTHRNLPREIIEPERSHATAVKV